MEDLKSISKNTVRLLEREVKDRVKRWKKYRTLEELLTELDARVVLRVLPPDMQPAELAKLTSEVELEELMVRARQCQRCHDGSACDTVDAPVVRRGYFHHWTGEGFDLQLCSRYVRHRLNDRLRSFGVPFEMSTCTFDDFLVDNDAKEACIDYCSEFSGAFKGKGLYITGDIGRGKTHLAVAVLKELVRTNAVHTAMFMYTPEFLNKLRNSYDWDREDRERFFSTACECDLLVLDDFGAERSTEWVREQFTIIINARWSNGLPVLITSNRHLGHYEKAIGARAHSRLEAMVPVVLVLNGKDQRIP